MRLASSSAAFAAVVLCLASAPARAAEQPDVCVTATVEGQKLQRAGKLVEARDRFQTCARSECPEDIISRCASWAQGVIDALPSMVVIARDEAGTDIPAARVRIDDGPPSPRSARAIELDPGTHRVVVEREGAPPVSLDVVLHEGEKNRSVLATFPGPKKPRRITERPVPPAVWVAGGIGVAALATFGFFAISGAKDRTDNHCDSDPGCPRDDKTRVDNKLFAADVALGIGVLAVGVTAWLYFSRPRFDRVVPSARGPLTMTAFRF